MTYLLLKADGKLYCADIPDYMVYHSKEWYRHYSESHNFNPNEEYEKDKAEAIANALPVINPKILTEIFPFGYANFVLDRVYPWNGGAEVLITKGGPYSIKVVRLSLPDNKPKGAREQIAMGFCQSIHGVEDCVYCTDSCDAAWHRHNVKELSNPEPECEKPITADKLLTQHPLCRMRDGWCRDCESSEYQKDCLIAEDTTELAALKAENTRLQSLVNIYGSDIDILNDKVGKFFVENERLKEDKAELIEALKDVTHMTLDPEQEPYKWSLMVKAQSLIDKHSSLKL